MTTNTPPRKLLLLLCSALAFSAARAQTPAPSNPPDNESSDDIVTLPVFAVVGSNDGSYSASESTTGSRVNSKVKDLPYVVNVLTSEFLKDFSIFEATDELSFMSAASGVDDGGNLNMRGFNGGTVNLRNGLASNGLIDTASLDRIELIQGPAAAIYGQASPGGTMVVTTKKPTRTPRQSMRFSAGSYSLNQVVFNASGPLGNRETTKLFYRFDSQYYHRLYEIQGLASTTRSATGTVVYQASPNTSVTFEASYLLRLNNNGGGIPFNYDSDINTPVASRRPHYTGTYAFNTANKIIHNPVDLKPRWNAVFGGSVEHRFNSWLSGKLAASTSHRTLVNYSSFAGSQYDVNPATATYGQIVNGRTNIAYSKDDFDYRNAALDLNAQYPLWNTKQRTLFTIDHSNQNRRGWNTTSTAAFNALYPGLRIASKEVTNANALVPYQGVSVGGKGGPSFGPVIYNKENNIEATGFFLRQEATILDDHIILVAGYRHDSIRGDFRAPNTINKRKIYDVNDSMLLGTTYRITPRLSTYVSRNESFSPMSITTSANPASATPRTTVGEGYETGFKGEMLEGRLGFTAYAYKTLRKNEQVTLVDEETGTTFTSYIGNTRTRGFGFEGNYRIASRAQVTVSYTRTDARSINQGRDVNAENRRTKGTPLNAFSSALKLDVMSGLSATLGVRYTAKTPAFTAADSPGPADPVTGLITTNPNGSRDVYVPSSIIWTAGTTYKWKSSRFTKFDHSVTLTAKNIFDLVYIVPGNNRTLGDRFGIYCTYSISR